MLLSYIKPIICNKVTKIIYKVLHFVLFIVVDLLKQNTK